MNEGVFKNQNYKFILYLPIFYPVINCWAYSVLNIKNTHLEKVKVDLHKWGFQSGRKEEKSHLSHGIEIEMPMTERCQVWIFTFRRSYIFKTIRMNEVL